MHYEPAVPNAQAAQGSGICYLREMERERERETLREMRESIGRFIVLDDVCVQLIH